MVQLVHRVVVLHVYRDLLGSLAVQHGESGANLNLAGVRARAKQRSNDPLLRICPSEVVVEDREEGYGVHSDGCRRTSNGQRELQVSV